MGSFNRFSTCLMGSAGGRFSGQEKGLRLHVNAQSRKPYPQGGEYTEESTPKAVFSQERGTANPDISPHLADIVNAWPRLSGSFRAVMRASVLAVIHAQDEDK